MTEREYAVDVVRRLRAADHQALWAGGCVRDQLLGFEPHDYDVATDARPEQVQGLFRRTIAVGASFGVIEVLGPKPLRVQVATFRSDGAYDDGRRPVSVTFSSPDEDAKRRDFTINGMFFDPLENRVIDYVGGETDLRAGIIRAIGDPAQRFTEDKLRLLRAVRFATRFGFALDPATAAAIRAMAGQITVVSAERIAEELHKLLADPRRARGVQLLSEVGLATAILPETNADGGRTIVHLHDPVSFPLGLAALLGETTLTVAANVSMQLRLSNAEKARVEWLVENRNTLLDAATMRKSKLKPMLAHPGIRELLALQRAIARATGCTEGHVDFCERCLREWPPEEIDPPPLLTGDDLLALGLTPGPAFKRILDAVREVQLEGTIATPADARTLAIQLMPLRKTE